MLSSVEKSRIRRSRATSQTVKSSFGQYLTPSSIASFMASLFDTQETGCCRLLDPGAGIGSLSCAFLERCSAGETNFEFVDITAIEIDNRLCNDIQKNLNLYKEKVKINFSVACDDFIKSATNMIFFEKDNRFTHAIMNPPYKKIKSSSSDRKIIRQVGIETVNFYAAFTALTVKLMEKGGQIVCILPRSFCNGPYFLSFRRLLLSETSIEHIHIFESRRKNFKDDGVLQENVIVKLRKGAKQRGVKITSSLDDSFQDVHCENYDFEQLVAKNDTQSFIHIPMRHGKNRLTIYPCVRKGLNISGLSVSTGPVVEFRLKEYLCNTQQPDSVPLLYPKNLKNMGIQWPINNFKKNNYIQKTEHTLKWLYPLGWYCLVRRFSSKEEKRRIVASVAGPHDFPGVALIGFENHLNVFHSDKKGLDKELATGLALYLNSSLIDEYFRRFSGHTQVNATDLRSLPYPDEEVLRKLGQWSKLHNHPSQSAVDKRIERVLYEQDTSQTNS